MTRPTIIIFIFPVAISLASVIGYYFFYKFLSGKKIIRKPIPLFKGRPLEDGCLLEKKLELEESIAIIRQFSESISFSYDLAEWGDDVVETTCKIFNLGICVLLLLDEATDTLSVLASRGIDKDFARSIKIRKGDEISGVVVKYNDVTIINDLRKEKQYYKLKNDSCYRNSLVSLPLSVKNKVLGVLNVSDRKTGGPFSPVDIEILKVIVLESAIALQNLRLVTEQQKNYLDTVIALAGAIDARDPYTYRHSDNVARHAVMIAQELKFSAYEKEGIRAAALLHDIGKIAISDVILSKVDSLTDEEYIQIKTHPARGEEIIKSLPFLQKITKIIRHHHERYDGKGYPDGIHGANIELGARILAVADSFDAMVSDRPYRKAISPYQAKNELIKNKGIQFDSSIVDVFLRVLEKDHSYQQ